MFDRGDYVRVVPDEEWPEHGELVGKVGRVVGYMHGGYMVGLVEAGVIRGFTEDELVREWVH